MGKLAGRLTGRLAGWRASELAGCQVKATLERLTGSLLVRSWLFFSLRRRRACETATAFRGNEVEKRLKKRFRRRQHDTTASVLSAMPVGRSRFQTRPFEARFAANFKIPSPCLPASLPACLSAGWQLVHSASHSRRRNQAERTSFRQMRKMSFRFLLGCHTVAVAVGVAASG